MTPLAREIRRRQAVLAHVERSGNVSLTCRFYDISRDTLYSWRNAAHREGELGLQPRSVDRRTRCRRSVSLGESLTRCRRGGFDQVLRLRLSSPAECPPTWL